jgi:hypothetical protein
VYGSDAAASLWEGINMKQAFLSALALLALSTIPATAVTVIDRTGPGQSTFGYDFDDIPVGETREIAILYPSFEGVRQLSLSSCLSSFTGLLRCERRYTDGVSAAFIAGSAFTSFSADCGKPGNCVGVRVTSLARDLGAGVPPGYATDFLLSEFDYNDIGVYADGTERNFGGNSGENFITVSYVATSATVSPVPVPAALPLLATGVAALGVLRKRRRKQ